jgi:hypothetical protein
VCQASADDGDRGGIDADPVFQPEEDRVDDDGQPAFPHSQAVDPGFVLDSLAAAHLCQLL